MQDNSHIGLALAGPPSYETEAAPYGLQAVALRPTADGRTYARVTQFFMPLVCVVPFGRARPQEGSMFAFAPVDDQNHLLFYGYYSDEPQGLPVDMGVVNPEYRPDPGDFTGVRGDRHNLWGQDRALMRAGHLHGLRADPSRGGHRRPDEHGWDPRSLQGVPLFE
jgi:phthalate 4,5-dioxygenase oxygenase subunit